MEYRLTIDIPLQNTKICSNSYSLLNVYYMPSIIRSILNSQFYVHL